jgi:hypothetical protein
MKNIDLVNHNPERNPYAILSSLNDDNEQTLDYYVIIAIRKSGFTQDKVVKSITEQYKEWNKRIKWKCIVYLQTGDIKAYFDNESDMNDFCQQELVVGSTKLIRKPRKVPKVRREIIRLLFVPYGTQIKDIEKKLSQYVKVEEITWETHKNFPDFKNGHVRCTLKVNENPNNIPGWICFEHPKNPNLKVKARVEISRGNKACFICGERSHSPKVCPNRKPCRFCKSIKHSPKYCPRRYNCFKCGQHGHYKRMCTNRKRKVIYTRLELIPRNKRWNTMYDLVVKRVIGNFQSGKKKNELNTGSENEGISGNRNINENRTTNEAENTNEIGHMNEVNNTNEDGNTNETGYTNENRSINEIEVTSENAEKTGKSLPERKTRNKSTNRKYKNSSIDPNIALKISHSWDIDSTDSDLDINLDTERRLENISQSDTNVEINSISNNISELDINETNNNEEAGPSSHTLETEKELDTHPKVMADLNSALILKSQPELENTNNPQLMKMKLEKIKATKERKIREIPPLTMTLRSRSRLSH